MGQVVYRSDGSQPRNPSGQFLPWSGESKQKPPPYAKPDQPVIPPAIVVRTGTTSGTVIPGVGGITPGPGASQ